MPGLALAICVVWFLTLFVFRSIVQWRRTGSTGLKGFHGRVGSLPWIAGAAVTLGFVLTPLAPVGALLAWPGFAIRFSDAPIHVVGAVLAITGSIGALVAQLSMGDSWRVGVDESETTALVTDGIFSWVRNPIYTFIWIFAVGIVLMVPNLPAVLALLLTVVGIEAHVRTVEEPHLEQTHGETYTRYCARVGRFVPAVGRLARG